MREPPVPPRLNYEAGIANRRVREGRDRGISFLVAAEHAVRGRGTQRVPPSRPHEKRSRGRVAQRDPGARGVEKGEQMVAVVVAPRI